MKQFITVPKIVTINVLKKKCRKPKLTSWRRCAAGHTNNTVFLQKMGDLKAQLVILSRI